VVPPVVAPAVVVHPDIHAVLVICGFANVMDHTSIINNEGFQSIADFGILEDKDMFEMVKCLGNRMVAAGRVNVGAIQVKKLQALCYWVRDQQKHGQGITQDDWDNDTVMVTIEKMRIEKGRDTGNVLVMDLGKFNPDDFETHETVFINLLAQMYGVQGENLKYIVHDVVIPAEFVNDAEWCMYQLPLTGEAYSMDNKSVYRLLKSFLVNTSGWTWIEPYDTMENGRGAFLTWTNHYNGQGELSKRTAMAKARVKSLFYKNERSLSFEKVTSLTHLVGPGLSHMIQWRMGAEHFLHGQVITMVKSFSTLDKDPDKWYSEHQKVEKLLQFIQMPDMEVVAQKSVIASQYANDFSGACKYFLAQVSRLHGRAQLENSKYTKKRNVSAMYGCSGRDGG
jgi:hypothetical protein